MAKKKKTTSPMQEYGKRMGRRKQAIPKPKVPMSAPPVDFTALPDIDLAEEWVRQTQAPSPPPGPQGKGIPVSDMERRVREAMASAPPASGGGPPKPPVKSALPPMTADTIPMVEEAAPVLKPRGARTSAPLGQVEQIAARSPAGGAWARKHYPEKFFQNRPSTLGQAGRNAMERQFLKMQEDNALKIATEMAEGAGEKAAKKGLGPLAKKIFGILRKNPKLVAAMGGGPMSMAMGGIAEAAAAEPVGVGQGMYGGFPGGEYAGRATPMGEVVGQAAPEDIARGMAMAPSAVPPSPHVQAIRKLFPEPYGPPVPAPVNAVTPVMKPPPEVVSPQTAGDYDLRKEWSKYWQDPTNPNSLWPPVGFVQPVDTEPRY